MFGGATLELQERMFDELAALRREVREALGKGDSPPMSVKQFDQEVDAAADTESLRINCVAVGRVRSVIFKKLAAMPARERSAMLEALLRK